MTLLHLLVRHVRVGCCARSTPQFRSSWSSKRHYATAEKLQLRPYQEKCIQAVLSSLSQGERRVGVSLATGSGKTVIFSHLVDRVPEPTPHATQTLILAHRRELVEQAAAHCRNLYPHKLVEIEMGKEHASGLAHITVASVPTLRSPQRLMRFDPGRFKLVLVDEAHHIVADSYMTILSHFNLTHSSEETCTALVGVSATLSRHDGRKIGAAIDHIVYHQDWVDMIDGNWLASAVFTTVQTGVDLSKVRISAGDFQAGALSNVVNNDETNAITVRAWLEKAGSRLSSLVFCVDIAHVVSLTNMFRLHGVDARFVTGTTPMVERSEKLRAFKAGEYSVLLNCGIFTEGTDIPNIDCIILARPTQSRNLLVQMIGRGLRKSPGKKNCHIIDMVSSLEAGVVTTPTLFGLEPNEEVQEADFKAMENLKERREKESVHLRAAQRVSTGSIPELESDVTFTDYDSVNDLIQDASGERHIRAISRYAWIRIGEGKYLLSNRSGSLITIEKEHDQLFLIKYTPKLPMGSTSRSPYGRKQIIGKAVTFELAVRAADTFAKERFPVQFIALSAPWRRNLATEKQLQWLNNRRTEDEKLSPNSITMGKAADWITKLKHGAQKRFEDIAKKRGKVHRLAAKQEEFRNRQDRQRVKVGPLNDNKDEGE